MFNWKQHGFSLSCLSNTRYFRFWIHNHLNLIWAPDLGDPFEFRTQIYRVRRWDILLLLSENHVVLAVAVLSQYTHLEDEVDNILWEHPTCTFC